MEFLLLISIVKFKIENFLSVIMSDIIDEATVPGIFSVFFLNVQSTLFCHFYVHIILENP
jgi:hypothetical protein